MNLFFNRKQIALESLLDKYILSFSECIELFYQCTMAYLDNGSNGITHSDVMNVHAKESRADDMQREVASMLYGRALFPESREDVLRLLRATDSVPNKAEGCIRAIFIQQIEIPESLLPGFKDVTRESIHCARLLVNCLKTLFQDYRASLEYVGQIDQLESQSDKILYELIQNIFSSNIPKADKIILKDLADGLADIADCTENAADHIRTMVIKRTV